MDLEDGIKRVNGTLEVEIQGFFTERFINLCKIRNIKIWNIKTIVTGVVRFNICISDFKSLKTIARKTKCKIKIISKKGIYFKIFRYRKRGLLYVLAVVFLALCIFANSFIWNIEIQGNDTIADEEIYRVLKDSGLYIGRNKLNLKTKSIINSLRVNVSNIAWVGIDIDGTKAYVEIVEKTNLKEDNREDGSIGDIVSTKNGIIEKVIAENGTPISNVGDYIESDRILIEGKLYSKFMDVTEVQARGRAILRTEYTFSKIYPYKQENKQYIGKKKYSLGSGINEKENYIKYLDKSLNYDIIKNSYDISIFGQKLSLIFYTFDLYELEEYKETKENILSIAQNEAKEYINNVILTLKNPKIIDSRVEIENENEEEIEVKIIYTLNEEDGIYRKRN